MNETKASTAGGRIIVTAVASLTLLAAACGPDREKVDYVNTRIGNISHLLVPTYPTTHLPNSMLRMIPDHNEFTTDRMGGLPLNVPSHRNGSVLMMMPYCGAAEGLTRNMSYRYDQEHSTPARYTVYLDDYGIVTDFVPAAKAAIFSCTFEQPGGRYIQIASSGGEIHGEGNAMWGYDNYRGIKQYFYLEFDSAPEAFAASAADVNSARFAESTQCVKARYGISYIDVEQAERNLREQIGSWDMDAMERDARTAWNNVLGRIDVEGGTEDQQITFYTALYRCHERMVCISEDGRYFSAFDGKVHDDEGTPFWTDDWVWDTYHALHPLQTILDPEAEQQKIASYIRMYEQSGWMPTFPCIFGDAHCMNGNHSAAVFADALCKGLDFDVERAYEGIRHTVLNETMIPWVRAPKTELDDFYHANGWFPALHPGEQESVAAVTGGERRQAVAVTLAASYDDWCISRLAQHLGRSDEYDFHLGRSFNYRNLFNHETGFFHPKDAAGQFIEPFDYIFSGGLGARDYYDENNAWTYIWDVHHNIADLIALFGGEKPFADKLDRLFAEGLHTSILLEAARLVGQCRTICHGQRAELPHTLPLQLRPTPVADAETYPHAYGELVPQRSDGHLRRRGRRRHVGLLRLLGHGILSRDGRHALLRHRQPDIRPRHHTPRQRQDLHPYRPQQLGRQQVHTVGAPERQTLRQELLLARGSDGGRHAGAHDGQPPLPHMGRGGGFGTSIGGIRHAAHERQVGLARPTA